ncbi:protein DBF4 homolog A [Genypterus blacodes]|uniref:protein DBF4 homolog A n=1 Tax=Genypterus blacodes TaxID=154954 RepID=UPI003F761B17
MKENTMKPRRAQRRNGASIQGKAVDAIDKSTLRQVGPTIPVSCPARVKPFAGKVFYLDLPSNRKAQALENDIKELGGTVEKFFSKEIKYLVSNKREAKYVQCLRQDSPVPSPESGQSSPHPRSNPQRPGSQKDDIKSRTLGQMDTAVTSRGKSLVERVVKEQERLQMNKILSNALEWGVKILYIDDVMAYVEKKKKALTYHSTVTTALKSAKAVSTVKQGFQKCKGGRISKPFIKVEDSCRHYRPIYLTMPNLPEFNLKTVPPGSPFCADDKDPPGNRPRRQRGMRASASEERVHGRAKKSRDKKRGGYCECCMLKYDKLTTHLQSERHKAFSRSNEYMVVDRLMSAMCCNFVHIKTKNNIPKCSMSSVVISTAPHWKTDPTGAVEASETINDEKLAHQAADGCEDLYSGHPIKMSSFSGSAPLDHRDGNRRNSCTGSGQSKHKSLARKHPPRQDSVTFCNTKTELPMAETAPSTEEHPASSSAIPFRVNQVDPVGHRTHTDTNDSVSHFHSVDIQNEFPFQSLDVKSGQQDGIHNSLDCSLEETNQEQNVLVEEVTGVSEKGGGSSTGSLSPAGVIQRRVRVSKHKRRKLDRVAICQEHLKPNDDPDNSTMKLGQLFQSNDDMDLEFRGFDDEGRVT